MSAWDGFDAFFGQKSIYEPRLTNKIKNNRKSLAGQLFFDRLLQALRVKDAGKLYPPEKSKDLRTLHQAITKSDHPTHHRQALLYYLLKDISNEETADHFTQRSYLPVQYRSFINGIWHLDRLECARALAFLTEPSLIPTYPDEILYTLIQHGKDHGQLAMAYYNTVAPPLSSQDTRRAYFAIVCQQSITSAYNLAQKQEECSHRALLEDLIFRVLSSPAKNKAEAALQLINLPLSDVEETWFDDCLLKGRASHLSGAQDTVMMRRVALGRMQRDGGDMTKLSGQKIEGASWNDVKRNLATTMSWRV